MNYFSPEYVKTIFQNEKKRCTGQYSPFIYIIEWDQIMCYFQTQKTFAKYEFLSFDGQERFTSCL